MYVRFNKKEKKRGKKRSTAQLNRGVERRARFCSPGDCRLSHQVKRLSRAAEHGKRTREKKRDIEIERKRVRKEEKERERDLPVRKEQNHGRAEQAGAEAGRLSARPLARAKQAPPGVGDDQEQTRSML